MFTHDVTDIHFYWIRFNEILNKYLHRRRDWYWYSRLIYISYYLNYGKAKNIYRIEEGIKYQHNENPLSRTIPSFVLFFWLITTDWAFWNIKGRQSFSFLLLFFFLFCHENWLKFFFCHSFVETKALPISVYKVKILLFDLILIFCGFIDSDFS
jgi:hypothetical protein